MYRLKEIPLSPTDFGKLMLKLSHVLGGHCRARISFGRSSPST